MEDRKRLLDDSESEIEYEYGKLRTISRILCYITINIYRNYRCITRGLYTDFTNETLGCGLYTGAGNTPIIKI